MSFGDFFVHDAIVIGAGPNGLTLALYLQRAGLKTLVVDRASKVGGMARTDNPFGDAFCHNTHANYLSYVDVMPMIVEFGLANHGFKSVVPEAQHGCAFPDGRPPVVLYRNDLLEKSVNSIAQYSASDAEVYQQLQRGVQSLTELVREGMYRPASRAWFQRQFAAVGSVLARVGQDRQLGQRSALSLIDALFEASEVRALFYQLAEEFGVAIDAEGSDISFVGVALWLVGQWHLPIGGMQSYSNALGAAAKALGVEFLLGADVSRIVVERSRARGVFVPGHGKLQAKKLVATTGGLGETLLRLVGGRNFKSATISEIRSFEAQKVSSLASMAFALNEPPNYKSAKWNPDINKCFHTMVGFGNAEETLAHLRSVNSGDLKGSATAVRVNTLWDPSQAPTGKHLAGADVFIPHSSAKSQAEWDSFNQAYPERFLSVWQSYADNMQPKNVLNKMFLNPGDYERKLYFQLGTDQYRTEINGLYMCGVTTSPGGGAHGACGHNAFEAICEDLQI